MDFKRIKIISSGGIDDGGLLERPGIGKSVVKNYRDFNIQTIAGIQNIKYKVRKEILFHIAELRSKPAYHGS